MQDMHTNVLYQVQQFDFLYTFFKTQPEQKRFFEKVFILLKVAWHFGCYTVTDTAGLL